MTFQAFNPNILSFKTVSINKLFTLYTKYSFKLPATQDIKS